MNQEVDFSVLTVREIRDVLKSKAHCLRAGFPPDHMIIKTLNEFRDHYLMRVGLPTYLNQMLGELSKVQMRYCTLYDEKGQQINVHLKGAHNQPVQRFIARNFSVHELPFKVEIAPASNSDEVEVRYL